MAVTGPDFIALQVRDLEKAASFYENVVGIPRAPFSPPHAVVFDTVPTFAVALHATVAAAGAVIVQEPFDGPFGTTFVFQDLDGYLVTVHDRGTRG